MAVLLLDASMQPLNVISLRRLVALLAKGRVALMTLDDEDEASLALEERRFPAGVVIVRLMRSIHIPRRMMRPNRRNLLLRDGHVCQYCGMHGIAADLTIDHITPISRGGAPDAWENCVVACRRCNWRKGNRRPEEMGMRLLREPRALTREYEHIIFMRHPELKLAYDQFLAA